MNLTTAEAAEAYGTTKRHVRDLCRRGLLPARRLGRQWRIAPPYQDDLDLVCSTCHAVVDHAAGCPKGTQP